MNVDEAAKFAKEEKMGYIEASAALNISIDKIFDLLGGKVVQAHKNKVKAKSAHHVSVLSQISEDPRVKRKRKCCE